MFASRKVVLINLNVNLRLTSFCSKSSIPEKPNKPLVPFFRYLAEEKPKTRLLVGPKVAFKEIVKIVASKWENLSYDLKSKYSQEFSDEMKDYIIQRAKYESKLTKEQIQQIKSEADQKKAKSLERKERKLQKKIKLEASQALQEPKKPKFPNTSFIRYLHDRMSEYSSSGLSRKEFFSSVAKDWENLPIEERKKYTDEYKRDYERYLLELSSWKKEVSKSVSSNNLKN